jgi:hypothetical protein
MVEWDEPKNKFPANLIFCDATGTSNRRADELETHFFALMSRSPSPISDRVGKWVRSQRALKPNTALVPSRLHKKFPFPDRHIGT